MDNDEDRIKQALARRSAQESNAASARAAGEAEQKRAQKHAQEAAQKFSTLVTESVRKAVASLNSADLANAAYRIAIAAASASQSYSQASSLLYAVKSSAGVVSAEMLVFKHVDDSVLIETAPNPHYHAGARQFRRPTSQLFKSRAVSIAEFAPAHATKALVDFVEVVLPTFPA